MEATQLNPQVHADDQTAIFDAPHNRGVLTVADAHAVEARARFRRMTAAQRRSTTLNRNYLVNDIVQEIAGSWMANAGCRLEIPLPEVQTPALSDVALQMLSLPNLKKLAVDKRQTAQADVDRSAAIAYHRVEHPHTRRHSHRLGQQGSHDYSMTASLRARRRKDHTTPGHPLNINPKWKLRAGPWLVGSIICDQWTPDTSGGEHPPAPRQGSRMRRIPRQDEKIGHFDKRCSDAGSG